MLLQAAILAIPAQKPLQTCLRKSKTTAKWNSGVRASDSVTTNAGIFLSSVTFSNRVAMHTLQWLLLSILLTATNGHGKFHWLRLITTMNSKMQLNKTRQDIRQI